MKKNFIRLLLAGALSFAAVNADAVPAWPGLQTVTLADGTQFKVRQLGDEWLHYYVSEDGYLLTKENGTFYYGKVNDEGKLVKTAYKATAINKRDAATVNFLRETNPKLMVNKMAERLEKVAPRFTHNGNNANSRMHSPALASNNGTGVGRFPGTSFPNMGKQKALVILVEFSDKSFDSSYNAHDYFDRMLNEEGFSDFGGTGCAAEYFRTCSGGRFELDLDLFGPVKLDYSYAYYGAPNGNSHDIRPHEMVIDACQKLDSQIDFSQYDRDNDGMIDNVFVIYAGLGQASGGDENTIWPHSWEIYSASGGSLNIVLDGKRLNHYACTNEWKTSGRPDGVGTFIHEFSHVMGLPDLYATSYTDAVTPGSWSVLDNGPYNNNGCTPPLYSVFERNAMGWMEPYVIDGPDDITLNNISTNEGCIIPAGSPNEFFLLENRQREGWDKYIPGHGMLVWHVLYDANVWRSNSVNNDANKQYVDIEEADGIISTSTRSADAFPSIGGKKTWFTDNTNPSMKTWGNKGVGLPLTEITENQSTGIITFKVAGGKLDAVKANAATDLTPVSFKVSWEKSSRVNDYSLSVFTLEGGNRVYAEGYEDFRTGDVDNAEVSGLKAETTYYCVVRPVYNSTFNSKAGPESNVVEATLPALTFEYKPAVALPATSVSGNGFVATWEPMDEAVDYILNVSKLTVGGGLFNETQDFENGMGEWSGTADVVSTNVKGKNGVSVKTEGAYIQSPVYDRDLTDISFWYRVATCAFANKLKIEAYIGAEWTLVEEYEVSKTAGEYSYSKELPVGTRAVRITSVKNRLMPTLFNLDDIALKGGQGSVEVPVDGLTGIRTGNTTSYAVNGVEPGTTYFYTVKAVNADSKTSLESNKISVDLSQGSGISRPGVDGEAVVVTVSGNVVNVGNIVPGTHVAVADISGRVIYSAVASDNVEVTIPATGVYIVKAGTTVRKVVIR